MSEGNGKLTDEQLLALSEIDIQDAKQYSDEDRKRREELLDKQRAERFAKDPYSFIEIKELLCAAIRDSKSAVGVSLMVNPGMRRTELNNAQAELNCRMELMRRSMDIRAEMHKQGNGLILPDKKGGMMNFARHKR